MALKSYSYRFGLRALFIVTTIVAVLLGLNAWQYARVKREHTAYKQLQALGATGDDWVGWTELLYGRDAAPIVDMSLPASLTLHEAWPHLMQLYRLKGLDLSGSQIKNDDLKQLEELDWIDSLDLSSTDISDDALTYLGSFDHLRWLYLENTRISDAAFLRLQNALPHCKIQR